MCSSDLGGEQASRDLGRGIGLRARGHAVDDGKARIGCFRVIHIAPRRLKVVLSMSGNT